MKKIVVGGSSVTAGQLEDLFRQIKDGSIGGKEMQAILEHKDPWVKPWELCYSTVYFLLESDGKTGKDWVAYFKRMKINISDHMKDVLLNGDFRPTQAGTTHCIYVMNSALFSDEKRITADVRREAVRFIFHTPHPEVACLIRAKFTNETIEKMGFEQIITMHRPLMDSRGKPRLFSTHRALGFVAYLDQPDVHWKPHVGFAFER